MIGQDRYKVMIHKLKNTPTAKHTKKVPKTAESVDTDSDDMGDEQGPAAKQPKKLPKPPEFVDTDSHDMDDEQERQPKKALKTSEYPDDEKEPAAKKPQKAPKTSEYPDDEQGRAVKCIVMYCTEDEQEPAIKKLQKTSKIPKFVDTDPVDESRQETSPGEPTKKPHATSASSSTHILTSGVRKGKQCRFKASDKTGKFCHHHKYTPN